ncbi:hypothetical protein WJX72_012155 [[Myrmecia] bisecta]|uniref:Uncharacterized protein n=1 Tax=[Myrmecia] bisecta TaxID=41462 RepID=A0AAW1PMN5_9CHLO
MQPMLVAACLALGFLSVTLPAYGAPPPLGSDYVQARATFYGGKGSGSDITQGKNPPNCQKDLQGFETKGTGIYKAALSSELVDYAGSCVNFCVEIKCDPRTLTDFFGQPITRTQSPTKPNPPLCKNPDESRIFKACRCSFSLYLKDMLWVDGHMGPVLLLLSYSLMRYNTAESTLDRRLLLVTVKTDQLDNLGVMAILIRRAQCPDPNAPIQPPIKANAAVQAGGVGSQNDADFLERDLGCNVWVFCQNPNGCDSGGDAGIINQGDCSLKNQAGLVSTPLAYNTLTPAERVGWVSGCLPASGATSG